MKDNSKFVYTFEEGDAGDKMLLGGKGANLCAMTQIGLDVPPGFVITTAACLAYLEENRLPDGLMAEVSERDRGARAQDRQGVRQRNESAARLGALRLGDVDAGNDGHDPQPRPQRGNVARARPRRPAIRASCYDAWRRFIQLFGKIAMGVADEAFDGAMAAIKRKHDAVQDVDLTADALQELADAFLAIYREHTGRPFPDRSRTSSSSNRSRPCSARGTASAPSTIAGSSGSPRTMANGTAVNVVHDGVRQHGRRFRDRRRLHAQSRAPART